MNTVEKLAEIRKRFVGSGEEHELLASLTCSYQEAYDRGAHDRENELIERSRMDADAVKFARALYDAFGGGARYFIETGNCEWGDWEKTEIVAWLSRSGKKPDVLRQLADALEASLSTPVESK